MRLGSALPASGLDGGPLAANDLATAARAIESAGYDSIWVFDAVGRGFMLPDPFMALTAAASVTERVELATGIAQLPIRNVAEVAHRVFTLELLAPGRVLLGVGPGSTEADFVAFGVSPGYDQRFATFDNQYVELRQWLANGSRSESGGDGALSPWPQTLAATTLALAGWRGRWVERAAKEASAWIASAVYADNDTLADAIGRYREAGGKRAVVTNIQVQQDPGPALERLHQLHELGFDDAVLFDLAPNPDRFGQLIEAFNAGL